MTHRAFGGRGNAEKMKLSPVQDQAIAARMALVVGATTFDRLFAGVQFMRLTAIFYMFSLKKRRPRPK